MKPLEFAPTGDAGPERRRERQNLDAQVSPAGRIRIAGKRGYANEQATTKEQDGLE